jgi:hypothetical protein
MIPISHAASTFARFKEEAALTDATFVPIRRLQHEYDSRVMSHVKTILARVVPAIIPAAATPAMQ